MKKSFLIFVSCLFFSLSMQAQSEVQLDHDTIIIALDGNDTTLVVTTFPATTTNLVWEIIEGASKIDTTTTGANCTISAVEVGIAKIRVTAMPGNFRDTCVIHVIKRIDDISIRRNEDTIKMHLACDTVLIAAISPQDANMDSVIWNFKELDQQVVSIEIEDDTVCYLSALTIGKVTLYTIAYDAINRDGTIKDSCVIEVSSQPIASLSFDTDSIFLYVGSETSLEAHLLPHSGIDKSVYWYSLNTSIVSLESAGLDTIYTIKAQAVGETKIVAQSVVDLTKTDTCVVTVLGIPAEKITLNEHTLMMHVNTDTLLMAHVLPFETTDKSIAWTSLDSSIVDIRPSIYLTDDTLCFISAIKSGTTKIMARSIDGDFSDSCVVQVIVPVDSVVFQVDSISLDIDSVYVLKAVVYPDSATYKSLTWSINEPSLIDTLFTDYDSICEITALKAGEAIIYIMSSDALCEDSCVVTINPLPVDSISIGSDSLNLHWEETITLSAQIFPAKASDLTVYWTSSDSSIVDIISTENDTICDIKGMQLGEATVYARTNDGGFVDSCVVTVITVVTGIQIPQDSISLYLDNDINTFSYALAAIVMPDQPFFPDIEWTSSDISIVDISLISADSVQLIPMSVGKAFIYAKTLDGDLKDSCEVTVKDQHVVLATDTTNVNGIIEVSVILPDNALKSGSFELHFPSGFGLTLEGNGFRTKLSDAFKDTYDLDIYRVEDSIYHISILPTVTLSSMPALRAGTSLLKLMDIAYTIYDNDLLGSKADYQAKFLDLVFELEGDTVLTDNQIDIVIKSFRDGTGNIVIIQPTVVSYIADNLLYIHSDKTESISVYSLNGSLLFTGNKKDGLAIFDMKTSEKILIVKGSSGWANKVVNK